MCMCGVCVCFFVFVLVFFFFFFGGVCVYISILHIPFIQQEHNNTVPHTLYSIVYVCMDTLIYQDPICTSPWQHPINSAGVSFYNGYIDMSGYTDSFLSTSMVV